MTAIRATETTTDDVLSMATRFRQWSRENILEFYLIALGATMLIAAAVFGLGLGV